MDLFSCFYIVVADRTQLFFMLSRGSYSFQLLELIFVESFGNFTDMFFQLQQFLVCHIVWIDINSSLIMHAHHHIPQFFRLSNAVQFI
jgi:hypothetical protein